MNKIPGLNVRSYALNEHKLCCKIDISYSDALQLLEQTASGLPRNRKLNELFMSNICEALEQSIKEMKERRNVPNN